MNHSIDWLSEDERAWLRASAIKLAEKYEAGHGPEFSVDDAESWCGCGIAHVCKEAGDNPMRYVRHASELLAAALDSLTGGRVSRATDLAAYEKDTSKMAPALRELAAALEAP